MTGHRCFVMPLNRDNVLPPKTLFDLIHKMWEGYYKVDTDMVRRSMRVVFPPLEDTESIGTYIANECADLPIYRLEKVERESKYVISLIMLHKRSDILIIIVITIFNKKRYPVYQFFCQVPPKIYILGLFEKIRFIGIKHNMRITFKTHYKTTKNITHKMKIYVYRFSCACPTYTRETSTSVD